jgi:hypothetical protein
LGATSPVAGCVLVPVSESAKKHESFTRWRHLMAKQPKKEAVKPETTAMGKAKEAVAQAAGKVASAVSHAAEAVNEHVVHPVAEAVGIVKPPKKRFVREKKQKKTPSTTSALTPRSTKATAKLMTKGLAVPPKEAKPGTRPKA